MGINFVVANPCKRQFFDPDALLDNSKSTGFLAGLHPRCVTLLCCRNVAGFGRGVGEWQGAWFGDSVYIIGDGSSEPPLPEFDDDPGGRDGRGLWSFVHEDYEDISYPLLASLCESEPELCVSLVEQAKGGGTDLVHLGNVVQLVGCEPLRQAIVGAFGRGWIERYGREYLNSRLGQAAAARRTGRDT